MLVNVCIAKLHRATVTDADLNYVGSITIDEALIDAAGLTAGQIVTINNLSNAHSWRTYIVEGKKGKGEIILNGPPARLFHKGDIVVIFAFPEEISCGPILAISPLRLALRFSGVIVSPTLFRFSGIGL